MSNYRGRKPEFTPAVYTRYFEQRETPKSSNDHVYFNENEEETSGNYQIKRDLLFRRLFPSKYAESDNDQTGLESTSSNTNNNSLNNTAQSLGDFIPLSNHSTATSQNRNHPSSPSSDIIVSSSDEHEEDILTEAELPTSTHESIVGHLHPRSTIANVRTILIRELYERTSDSHTEWLKCKMELPRDFINPKYYADFQRRYKKEIQKNTTKKNKSNSKKNITDNGYHVYDGTKTNETTTTTQIKNTLENDDIVETLSIKRVKTVSLSSPIVLSSNSPHQQKSIPEYIVLDTDDEDDELNQDTTNSSYFIDRSSNSLTAIPQPTVSSTEDYKEEDSKYAQLPSRNTTSSSSIIRPILSKHQRRKQSNPAHPPKPLVSAIDRIIDQMDQSTTFTNSTTSEQENLLLKQMKKRKNKKKKKKKKAMIDSVID